MHAMQLVAGLGRANPRGSVSRRAAKEEDEEELRRAGTSAVRESRCAEAQEPRCAPPVAHSRFARLWERIYFLGGVVPFLYPSNDARTVGCNRQVRSWSNYLKIHVDITIMRECLEGYFPRRIMKWYAEFRNSFLQCNVWWRRRYRKWFCFRIYA